jgi:hypothetical protein
VTNAELETAIQNEGFDIASLTAAQWNSVAANAVRKYTRHRPRFRIGTITTVADVQDYDLPAGGHLCVDLAEFGVVDDLTELGFSLLDIHRMTGDVILDFHHPTLFDIYRNKLASFRRQTGIQWEQHEPGGQIHIMPRPSSVHVLAVLYTLNHATADTVPDGDTDLLIKAGRVAVMRALANVGHTSAAGVASGGRMRLGPFQHDAGGIAVAAKDLRKAADDEEDEFNMMALDGAPVLKG